MNRRSAELPTGQRVGTLEIDSLLGKGATAHVYRARTPKGDEVALKIRERVGGELDSRFIREFESLRRLRRPGVVDVYEAGQNDEWQWFTMEVVDGIPMRAWIQEPDEIEQRVERACEVGARLCDILSKIHDAGLVHRDLKPSNVFVTAEGDVRVMDFGVVGWWSVGANLTSTGAAVGTLPYMSPEQMAGHRPTPAVDIFSTGIILYEGVAGKRPRPEKPRGWIGRQMLERLTPLACLGPSIPRDFSAIVARCLELEPTHRPGAAECAELLRSVGSGHIPSPWPEPPVFVGRESEIKDLLKTAQGIGPRLVFLRGEAGSGRRRILEQLSRHALLNGQRVLLGTCRQDTLGGAIENILDTLLHTFPPRQWSQSIPKPCAQALLAMWPSLPLRSFAGQRLTFEITRAEVIQAAADLLHQASEDERLVLGLLDTEDIDSLSNKVLQKLLQKQNDRLTLLAVLDSHWASQRAQDLLASEVELGRAKVIEVGDIPHAAYLEIAQSLAPNMDTGPATTGKPLDAVTTGLKRLAELRGEIYPEFTETDAILAAVHDAIPPEVLDNAGNILSGLRERGLVYSRPDGRIALHGLHTLLHCRANLRDRVGAHHTLGEAWANWKEGGETRWIGAATHFVRQDRQSMKAWDAAVQATLAFEERGQYAEARRWLMLLDTMPGDRESKRFSELRFSLAWSRARIAHFCDTERIRNDLVKLAAVRAQHPREQVLVAMLQVQALDREGQVRKALVQSLRAGGNAKESFPHLAARCLLDTIDLRLELVQPTEALLTCDHIDTILDRAPNSQMEAELTLGRARCLQAQGKPQKARKLAEAGLRMAESADFPRGVALGNLVCATALLEEGWRGQAEEAARRADRLFTHQGNRKYELDTLLLLGELALGRGEVTGARLMARDAVAISLKMSQANRHAKALDLQLRVLGTLGDWDPGETVLAQRKKNGGMPQTAALAEVFWWRIQRRPERAQIAADRADDSGYLAAWTRLELARCWLEDGQPRSAAAALNAALQIAVHGEHQELQAYGDLIRGVIDHQSNEKAWEVLVEKCLSARWSELFLGALEFDARRKIAQARKEEAIARLEELGIRSDDLGQHAYVETAARLLKALDQVGR